MARLAQIGTQQHALISRLRRDSLLRNTGIYLAGSLLAGLLGYVFHFVTGRLLGPAEYADVAAVLAALYIVSLPSLVVQIVSARFVSLAVGRGESGTIPRLLLRISAGSLAFGVAGALVLVLLAGPIAGYLQLPRVQLVYVLAVASATALLVTANRGALQGMRRFWALSGNTVLDLGLRVVTAIALISAGLGALGGILALLAGPAVSYLQGLFLVRQPRAERGAVAGAGPSFSEVGRYTLSASIAAVGVTYLFNVDVILAKHYLSAEAAGIYAAGSVLARAVYFLGLTVAGVMFPEVATLHARNQAHFHVVDRSLLLLGLIAIGLAAAYLVLPGLVLLPYGHGYDPVRPYLGPFAVALGLLALSNLLVNYFLSVDSRRFALPLAGACVLETVLVVAFHRGVAQIVAVLVVSMAALFAALGALYVADRARGAERSAT
jgi:O-antigen/teichoic acid export membrane protein